MELRKFRKLICLLKSEYRFIRNMSNHIRFKDQYGVYKMEKLECGDFEIISGCYYVSRNGRKLKLISGDKAIEYDELAKINFNDKRKVLSEKIISVVRNKFDCFVFSLWEFIETLGLKENVAPKLRNFLLIAKSAFLAQDDRSKYVRATLFKYDCSNDNFLHIKTNLFGLEYFIKIGG